MKDLTISFFSVVLLHEYVEISINFFLLSQFCVFYRIVFNVPLFSEEIWVVHNIMPIDANPIKNKL